MSTDNVELVRQVVPDEIDLVEVLASENPAAAFTGRLELLRPDVEVEFAGSQSGAPALIYRGIDGLFEGWREWLIPWESYRFDVEEFIDAGDQVIALARISARTSRHGVEVEHSPAAVWTVKEGGIAAVHFFLERADAFEFAGVSRP